MIKNLPTRLKYPPTFEMISLTECRLQPSSEHVRPQKKSNVVSKSMLAPSGSHSCRTFSIAEQLR